MSRETRLGLLIALAGVVIAAITALGSWKQLWTGLGTFADTPAAKWILVVSAAAALLAIGWGLKRKIDGNRRFRNELQAAVVLHQRVLLALVSGESGARVHEAVGRAREEIGQRGISADQCAAVRHLLEDFDQQLNRDEMERLRYALREAQAQIASQEQATGRGGADEGGE